MRSYSLAALVLLLSLPKPDDREAGFLPLLKGNDLATTFDFVGLTPDSASIEGGEFRLSGRPRGYLATKASHGDATIRFEWKFELPEGKEPDSFEGNGGVLLGIEGPARVWPRSLQLQLATEDPGRLLSLDGAFDGKTDAEAQAKASRPAGQWNESEVSMDGDRAVSRLNGVEVSSGRYSGKAGPIGFQSQGSAMRFRNVRIGPARR